MPAPEPASEHETDEMVLDEEEWKTQGEVNWEAGDECLSWMGSKVLQHAGFQGKWQVLIRKRVVEAKHALCTGSSTAALNVLTSVASEYLQNVGRTIRFLCDKYSNTMTPEVSMVLIGATLICLYLFMSVTRKLFCTPSSRAVPPRSKI
jgi:transcriptional activator SPT7